MGSLETCTHVIQMPESHCLALVLAGIMHMLVISFDMHKHSFIPGLFFPPHHMFIHDIENAIINSMHKL